MGRLAVLKPGDPDYDANYRTALYHYQEYGEPMPYASADDQ